MKLLSDRYFIGKSIFLLTLSFILTIGWAAISNATLIYSNNFEGTVGPEWSYRITDVTPVGHRRFLGQFNNNIVSLTLNDLPTHKKITVSFELFIIDSWDGNNHTWGPDIWNLQVEGGPTLLYTTFSNTGSLGHNQAYPGTYPGSDYPAQTGAAEVNTLGYTFYGDSVYDLSFTFPHDASSLTLDFSAQGLQSISDESWGLDNVKVSTNTVPEPSTIMLICTGLIGLLIVSDYKRSC